jgi:1,4-alpha-glucan branching enzyme
VRKFVGGEYVPSAPVGAFTFVLHSHLPYARLAGRWPHGEEWIHEAAVETYIPLLQTLNDLKAEGVNFRLTLGLTPVLLEQLADPDILRNLEQYLDDKIAAAAADQVYFSSGPDASVHLKWLAGKYEAEFRQIKQAFIERFNRNLISAFRQLQDEGYLEILTSAATHAYLPLLANDRSLHLQLQAAVTSYQRHFGRAPKGFWLPECAYRPAYYTEDKQQRAGLETILARYGITHVFSETHTITGGKPVGVAAGEVLGPYGYIKRRYVIPANPELVVPERPATTFKPYYISDSNGGHAAASHSGVAVIGRNNQTGMQVWSAKLGYPGDFDYREFHKRAGTSGLRYWRVTGVDFELDKKADYQPEWAGYKLDQHAEHFAHLVEDALKEFHKQTGEFGIIASNYDTELFGHWWYEGVQWLGKVLRFLALDKDIDLTTAATFLQQHPPQETLHLPESSWGANGTHFTWDNGETHWMWEVIHAAESRMESLVLRFPDATSDIAVVLNQIARELLLLQSSDWPFLVTTGQAREYAIQRFSQHVERFNTLAASVEAGTPDRTLADSCFALDNIFAEIDYRWYAVTNT